MGDPRRFLYSCHQLRLSRTQPSAMAELPAADAGRRHLGSSLLTVQHHRSVIHAALGRRRALSPYQTATIGGMAAGSWGWGELADIHGVTGALIIASGSLAIGGLLGLVLRQPDFESLNLDPANMFSEPQLQLDLRDLITIVNHTKTKTLQSRDSHARISIR
jgi:hypothetical protein